MSMSPSEVTAFLDRTEPALLGVVGTLRGDGSPHVVPVWYRYDGAAVYIWSDDGRGWVRNLRRDPRVAFSVQELEPPYAAVLMRGRAEIRTSNDQHVTDEIRRITGRYIEGPEVESYIAGWAHLRTIVTIHPERVTSWTRGY
jgi:PPOX class probable F420-dependent enzyme